MNFKMVLYMTEIGKIIKCMEKEVLLISMEINGRENLFKEFINLKYKVNLN